MGLETIKDSVERAKNRRIEALSRFHIGDVAYPMYQDWEVSIWGTIVNIDPVAYKVTINMNGVERQYDPEELVLTVPELKVVEPNQKAVEVAENIIKQDIKASLRRAMYYKEKPNIFRVSQNEQEENVIRCPKCKELMNYFFDKEERKSKFICDNCGRSILVKNVRYGSKKVKASKELDPKLYLIRSASGAFKWILEKIAPVYRGIKRDTSWREIRRTEAAIESLGVNYVSGKVDDSNYRTDGGTKIYNGKISFENIMGKTISLDIQIMASACGTVDEPWGAYDITLIMTRGNVR